MPVPADYDGDGRTDLAVFRPSTGAWYIRYTSTGSAIGMYWGTSGDVPRALDYDGDGKADPCVRRPSSGVWYILLSSNNYNPSAAVSILHGNSTDIPVDPLY